MVRRVSTGKPDRNSLEAVLPNCPSLGNNRSLIELPPILATLRTDIVLFDDTAQLRWNGPTPTLTDLATQLDAALTEARRPITRRSGTAPILRSAPRR